MTLSKTDKAVIELVATQLNGDEDAGLKLGFRASAIAVDRWGRDLDHRAGNQEYSHFEQALAASVTDVIDYYRDDEADVDGVDGYVFEGRVIDQDSLVDIAADLTEVIVDLGDVDRDASGGLVELVDDEGDAA
jgi:hypothetical protein